MNLKLAIGILVLVFYLFAPPLSARAQSPVPSPEVKPIDVQYESVNPKDGGGYVIKRFKEKVAMFFSFTNSGKLNNLEKQAKTRLAELKLIVDDKQMGFFEKATQRYFTTAGQMTDFVVAKKMNNNKDEVMEILSSHLPVLMILRDKFPDNTKAEWRFLEDDVNYVKMYIEKLK